ncbi:quinol:cytochrome C oxidoreductase [Rubrivirga sp. SAORIC476]|uniref:c-type cytochrome n=1 Tax=Rubrivirga sp. SAORIC476 TaxID=1961794 RepID=UPI000BA94A02|nr:cytochrome c [Rubrivirga sp. SAORIC476]MAQ93212.1 quinol:cytochrome C oxidoreductase [Rhodothermaceae bacterium]MBC14491.1 quinol:cytochrome C oxidoreductase [Rhodothermaceae bacterium]PAP81208.1 quinol:cytochrome C oxidoreductase [Rubrivirga sp. SAORIC476]
MTHRLSLLALTLAVALGGCRGMKSEKPPIHPNLNMDYVQRFEAQEANPLFEDGAAMRTPVAGTVARGQLKTTDNAPFEYGRTADGAYVADIPVPVTADLLERGQERYNIYCTVCHGYAGDGRGIVAVGNGGQGYGFAVPSYHTDALRARPDGYIYDVIQNGVNTMPSYGHEIAPDDRWAVVAYIRALQRSQNASSADVPQAERDRLRNANDNVRQN